MTRRLGRFDREDQRRTMRYILTAAFWVFAFAMASGPSRAYAQAGYDRFGGDFTNFTVRTGDPAVCAARCEREPRCRAWSFSYPGAGGGGAICWLKSQVPPRTENACCVSGVRGAGVIEPRNDGIEWGIDRIGGDLRNFEVAADPTGAVCKAACDSEGRCRAWTYMRPGYEGPAARCYLKNRLTLPRKRPCCISGVVR
jgi:PAN domain